MTRRHARRRPETAAARSRRLRPAPVDRLAGRTYDIRLPLLGAYQASNALLAAGLAIAAGEPAERVLPALENLQGVKGRLEIVGEGHAAASSSSTTRTSPRRWPRPSTRCARSRPARWCACSAAAATATRASGRSWATSPPPRPTTSSSPTTIRAANRPRPSAPRSSPAAPGAREIGDRAEAIRAGVRRLGQGDVLLIAGKGHETGQIVGSKVLPFSDHEAVCAAALARGAPIRCR